MPDPDIEAARLAGWDPADGPAPYSHGLPPAVDPNLGNNGVPAPQPGDPDAPQGAGAMLGAAPPPAGCDVAAVIAEHHANVGFREGPNNANPWGPEQGMHNAAYCDSAASVVPYHHGYRWWPESQFGEKGCAYCPHHVSVGANHGEVVYDHASQGQPADVKAGDLLFYDWNNTGIADHVETAIESCPSGGRTHNVGYNTGKPEGCYDLWRDRRFLLCRLRPAGYAQGGQPSPAPTPVAGSITMYDSVTAADIPHDAVAIMGYIDGPYAWATEHWGLFPNAIKIRIAVRATANDGHVLDCEAGDATPGECPGWVAMRKAAGVVRPVIYCNLSTWPAVQQAMASAGQTCDYLIAHPSGKPHTFPGAVGCQYSWPNTGSGGHFDLSWITDTGWMSGQPTPPVVVKDNPGTGTFQAQHPELALGAQGDAVRHLQMCIGIAADGDFGPQTQAALINVQRIAGLGTDGVCGPDTWSNVHVTVQPASTGDAVKEVQAEVGVAVDGDDGPDTTNAIMGFQQHAGLGVDGVCGRVTYRAMFN